MSPFKRFSVTYLVCIAIVASFLSGWWVGVGRKLPRERSLSDGSTAVAVFDNPSIDTTLYKIIVDRMKTKYVDQPVDEQKMFYGSLAGLVSSVGDPYTAYFDPDTAKKFSQELEGSFDGIGAEIGIKDHHVVIIAPLAQTPAARAGLKAGDIILSIDKHDTQDLPLDVAVGFIRGPKGSTVKLSIFREGFKEPKEFSIIRDRIEVQSVEWKVIEREGLPPIGLITVSSFDEGVVKKFNDAVTQVLSKDVKGIILDLRNDPGGFLDASVDVAGAWLKRGDAVVYEQFHSSRSELKGLLDDKFRRPYRVSADGPLESIKTVVLVNRGTASAAEIVSGALQDYKKATLIGEKTFGKGSVQEYEQFPDDSALKVTVAKWLTPLGRAIDKEGIKPDITVEAPQESQPSSPSAVPPKTQQADTVLEKALTLFRSTH